jgi:hypothetical protein
MLRKYWGGGILLALGTVLLLQSQTYDSLPTVALSIILEAVAISLLYSAWREL